MPRLAKADSAGAIPIGVIANGPQIGSNVQGLAYLALKAPLGDDATAANAANMGSPFNVLSLAPDIANRHAERLLAVLVGPCRGRRAIEAADVVRRRCADRQAGGIRGQLPSDRIRHRHRPIAAADIHSSVTLSKSY